MKREGGFTLPNSLLFPCYTPQPNTTINTPAPSSHTGKHTMEPISIITAALTAIPSIIAAIQFLKRKRYQEAATTIIRTIETHLEPNTAQTVKRAVANNSQNLGNRKLVHDVVQESISK